jgi:hypothetical protein
MYLETHTGDFIEKERSDFNWMSREELVAYLEARGTACFDDESTDLLRECAIDDFESEQSDSDYTASPYDLSHCRR